MSRKEMVDSGWRMPRGEAPAWMKAKRAAAAYWPLVPPFTIAAVMIATDLTGASSYWRAHPVLTNLVTGGILVLAVAFGLDRIVAARARRRWRTLGLLVTKEFEFIASNGPADAIACRVMSYCERSTGEAEIPGHLQYSDVVPLALCDPETWTRDSNFEVPGLLEEVEETKGALEEQIARWAPVVIAEPDLSAITVRAAELLPVMNFLIFHLRTAYYSCTEPLIVTTNGWEVAAILHALDELSPLEIDLWQSIAHYKTGQPLQPWHTGKTTKRLD